jgi:hypothetical protein
MTADYFVTSINSTDKTKLNDTKQAPSPRWRGSVNRDKTKGQLSKLGFSR